MSFLLSHLVHRVAVGLILGERRKGGTKLPAYDGDRRASSPQNLAVTDAAEGLNREVIIATYYIWTDYINHVQYMGQNVGSSVRFLYTSC